MHLFIRKSGRYEGMAIRAARESLEREMNLDVLARQRDNITRAAEVLGISRPTMYELIEKLGIAEIVCSDWSVMEKVLGLCSARIWCS